MTVAEVGTEYQTAVPPVLEAQNIVKRFGAFTANDQINLHIQPGEILALLGENGAGKSTFVKMVYGLLSPDEGQLFWQGEPVTLTSPQQARQMGIGMVFQHFSLFEMLTVAENIELALSGSITREALPDLIIEKSEAYGIPLHPDSLIADLSVSQRQRVEILRCLLQDPQLLILDEPTSVLTPQEAQQLFEVIERLAEQGCAVLFISHKLDEVKHLARRAVILRGGNLVADVQTDTQTTAQLASLMVGKAVAEISSQPLPDQTEKRFEIEGVSRPAGSAFAVALEQISLSVQAGEILGIAGVAGNGQTELMDVLTGEWVPQTAQGRMLLHRPDGASVDVSVMGPSRRRQHGMGFVPEERNGHGAVLEMSLSENGFLTSHHLSEACQYGQINQQYCHDFAQNITQKFDVRLPKQNPLAAQLSGGNLQKFVVGREMLHNPSVLIVSQPTWGVDVGAAMIIRKAMLECAEKGAAIILISQDLEEIFSLSHHIAVLHEGRLSAAYPTAEMSAEKVGLLMGGAS